MVLLCMNLNHKTKCPFMRQKEMDEKSLVCNLLLAYKMRQENQETIGQHFLPANTNCCSPVSQLDVVYRYGANAPWIRRGARITFTPCHTISK